jgi:uncharacterized protein (DUF3820 family)
VTLAYEIYQIAELTMPFGKYIGKSLWEVPLRYLDETVSVMPANTVVRMVIKMLDNLLILHMTSCTQLCRSYTLLLNGRWSSMPISDQMKHTLTCLSMNSNFANLEKY